jgi:putative hydrolase of the HAD superfamily
MKPKFIVFDLDDTLIYEIDYLKSAYQEISRILGRPEEYESFLELYFKGENTFKFIETQYGIEISELLSSYRNHFPTISLVDGAQEVLEFIKSKGYKLGLITDGRSKTQRNKLKATNIEHLFLEIIISEEFGSSKPAIENYLIFEEKYPGHEFYYIGDNFNKDFISPNKLGWKTIGIVDNGHNIHKQNTETTIDYLPQIKIKHLADLIQENLI